MTARTVSSKSHSSSSTWALSRLSSIPLCRRARVAAVSLVGVIALATASQAFAAPSKDPRVCEGWSHGTAAYHATMCSTARAHGLSWSAAMSAVGAPTPYAPECVPTGMLRFRCLLHDSTAAIAVSWDPVTFKPTVTIGPLAVKVLAASKARVDAARAADAAG